jgi:hypothetical protein
LLDKCCWLISHIAFNMSRVPLLAVSAEAACAARHSSSCVLLLASHCLSSKCTSQNVLFCCLQFLLKLPVQPGIAAAQRAVYPSVQAQQQPDDSSSSDEGSDSDSEQAPAAAGGGGSKRGGNSAKDDAADDSSSDDEDDKSKPFSDDEETNGAAAMEVDGDSSEGWDEEDDKPTKSAAKQSAAKQSAAKQSSNAAAQQQQQAGGVIDSGSWMAPPKPMRELVGGCLGWSEQQQLAALGSNKRLQRRMTNVAQLVRIDWGDVCAQVSPGWDADCVCNGCCDRAHLLLLLLLLPDELRWG